MCVTCHITFPCLYATSISGCEKFGRGRRPGDGHTTLTVLPQGFLDKYDYESRTPCVDGVQCSTVL